MKESLRDRYRGVLVGKAVGDALGATVEFMSRDEIHDAYGVHREITGGGWLNLPAGEVTDDTQLALCISDSIVEQQGFDPVDVGRRFVAWYKSDPPDIGNTTRRSLAYLASGISWAEAGERTHLEMRPRDASNGSIMRCAPVAMLYRDRPDRNAEASADSSRITHANPLSIDGCVALNAAIGSLLVDPDADSLDVAIGAARTTEVRESLRAVRDIGESPQDASGYVLATLQSAFWAVETAADFETAIVTAVNLGEDADTTGAVAGALAGAKWGYSAIPSRWRNALLATERYTATADEILTISDSI